MSTLILSCAGLVLLSGLFYLFPRRPSQDVLVDESEANLEWYRIRQAELSNEANDGLEEDAKLRLLEDDRQQTDVTRSSSSGHFPRWALLPLVAVFAGGLYYQLGAGPDVVIGQQLRQVGEHSSPEAMLALQESIERRSAQRPDNLHYKALLGRFYMGQQDYSRAATLYGGLAQEAPGDAQALAYAAQAEYLAGGRELSERAQMFAEQALAIDPHQRTALGLLGMASFEIGQYRAAIEYWQRLLSMEPADSESAQMIAGVIARAKDKLGVGEETAVEAASSGPVLSEASSAGVTVQLRFPSGVDVRSADTVFVLARAADSDSRMPVAVQRLSAGDLPVTLRLDDSKSMAGQKLSELDSIVVVVQVSADGRPGEANASWLGGAGPLSPSTSLEPIEIELKPRQ